jgi:hypothetical protein
MVCCISSVVVVQKKDCQTRITGTAQSRGTGKLGVSGGAVTEYSMGAEQTFHMPRETETHISHQEKSVEMS